MLYGENETSIFFSYKGFSLKFCIQFPSDAEQ